MEDRLEKLERAVEALETVVARQERRLAAIEGDGTAAQQAKEPVVAAVDSVDTEAKPLTEQWPLSALKGTPTLVGRSLLILAGAFLLRAFTEAGSLAPGGGVVLGLAYGASWIVAAAMAARKGARASAGFFGVCAAVIAGPLIFEAATEFGVLSPTGSAVVLTIMTAAGLFVASRWRLPESAWVFVIGAMVTGAALAVVRPPGEAATAVLVAVGLAAAWLAGIHRWESLRWLTAIGADVGVLRLTAMATAPGGPHGIDPPNALFVAVLQAALFLGYVGSSFARAVPGRHRIRVFDYLQTAVAIAVGWGGVLRLARTHEVGTGGIAVSALAIGIAAYGVAFKIVEGRQGSGRSFLFLTTLGLALVLLALPMLVGGASAVVWAVLALVGAVAGSRWDRLVLRVHAVVLLIAAWISSGLVTEASADLSGRLGLEALPGTGGVVVAVLTVITTLVMLFGSRITTSHWLQRLPQTVLLVMSGIVVAVTMVSLTELVAPTEALWVGSVALSMLTILSALLASRWGVREAGWVVYPLLALTGLRVLLADLASGRTVVFVIALAAYGAALITSPKILRSRRARLED